MAKKVRTQKSTRNPWVTLDEKEVFQSPWIRVVSRRVRTPTGLPSRYGVVQFKNIAVGVLTLDAKERVLLVGQFRYPLDQYSWEIPEGGCPEGTSPRAAAIRELKEETGYSAASLKHFMSLHLSNSVTDERAEIFIATKLRAGRSEPEETEELQTKWVQFKEALRLVECGKITDAISVAAILRYALIRSRR